MTTANSSDTLVARNSRFYNALWTRTYLTRPEKFNTWPIISRLVTSASQRLEVGPGMRPRLPIAGSHFLDLSPPVVEKLKASGGLASVGQITKLPFDDQTLDLVVAFDVVEHVENDEQVFSELTRVLKWGGRLIFSVPLHASRWTPFDEIVGHARRYEPSVLTAMISNHGLRVEKTAVYGMQSNNPVLLRLTFLAFKRHYNMTVRFYNWVLFPLGRLFQKRLHLVDGFMDLAKVDEVLMVCIKAK